MPVSGVNPTQSNVQAALRAFLLAVLPPGTVVIAGQQNRSAEPSDGSFVVMTPTFFGRLETNVDVSRDAKFTGSISGLIMTITEIFPDFPGRISVGSTMFGVGLAANTVVTALGTGTGGLGTYSVSRSQTVGSRVLSAGATEITQAVDVTVQLDFHSSTTGAAGDMAQTVSTLLRDEFGVTQFAEQDPAYGVVPLYADDPRQAPFLNAEQQYEWRWVLEVHLQANQVVSVPQQFADVLSIEVISVDATYPP